MYLFYWVYNDPFQTHSHHTWDVYNFQITWYFLSPLDDLYVLTISHVETLYVTVWSTILLFLSMNELCYGFLHQLHIQILLVPWHPYISCLREYLHELEGCCLGDTWCTPSPHVYPSINLDYPPSILALHSYHDHHDNEIWRYPYILIVCRFLCLNYDKLLR